MDFPSTVAKINSLLSNLNAIEYKHHTLLIIFKLFFRAPDLDNMEGVFARVYAVFR